METTNSAPGETLVTSDHTWQTTGPSPIMGRILAWITDHPGCDAERVAEEFGIHPVDASAVIEDLLASGQIEAT